MDPKIFSHQNRRSELSIDELIISESLWCFVVRKRQNKFPKNQSKLQPECPFEFPLCICSLHWTLKILNFVEKTWSQFRERKFKRALRLRFWMLFFKFILPLFHSKLSKIFRYDLPINRKLWFSILAWKNFWVHFFGNFVGNRQTEFQKFKFIVCLHTV